MNILEDILTDAGVRTIPWPIPDTWTETKASLGYAMVACLVEPQSRQATIAYPREALASVEVSGVGLGMILTPASVRMSSNMFK